MIFHVARDGQPLGTFTQEEIRDHLELERLHVTDLVWTRGMDDWEALAQVFEVEILDEEAWLALPPQLPPSLPGAAAVPGVVPKGSVEPGTSGWAIASLFLGIVSLGGLCFTGIPAIMCGHTALTQIRKSGGGVGGKLMARLGLGLGYLACVLSVLAALGLLIYGAVGQVQAKSSEADAMTQARTVMMALKVYAADNGGRYPAELGALREDGLITNDKSLTTAVVGWVGKPGWKYYGAGLGPVDHYSKIILESQARDLRGRGIQVTNDGEVKIVPIEDGPVK